MSHVPSEQFVTSITGKTHSYGLARELAYQEGRNLGTVREWLVIQVWQSRDDRHGFVRCYIQLGMLSTQVSSNSRRVLGFVESSLVKPDCKGPHWRRTLRLHQGHDRRRINPSGQ